MITVSTNEARAKFSEIIDASQHEAVEIARHDRVVSVIMSKRDFDRLKKIEDEWWMNSVSAPAKSDKDGILQAIKELEDEKWIEDPLV